MTPLQKGQFAQFSARKWDKVVKNDIKLPSKGHRNIVNTTQVGRKSMFFLKTEYLQWSHLYNLSISQSSLRILLF